MGCIRATEGKDQSEEQRSVLELPICSFHGSESIVAGDECKVLSRSSALARSVREVSAGYAFRTATLGDCFRATSHPEVIPPAW